MLLVAGLMFSAVLLVFIVSAGLIIFSYFWWKTRALRRQMREQMSQQTMDGTAHEVEAGKGEIIEGEVIRRVVSIEEVKR